MDATEYQLRAKISALEEKIEKLEEETEYLRENCASDYQLNEVIRRFLVSYGLIERAAEDE